MAQILKFNKFDVHTRHCNQGEYIGDCKYNENEICTALRLSHTFIPTSGEETEWAYPGENIKVQINEVNEPWNSK